MPAEPFEMPEPHAFAQAVRYYRLKRNLSQRQLADRLAIRPGPMSNLERGRHYPSFALLLALTRALDITADELLQRAQRIAAETRAPDSPHIEEAPEPSSTVKPCAAAEEYPFAGLTHCPVLSVKRRTILNRHLARISLAWLELEKLCEVPGFATVPLMLPVEKTERGANALARQIRTYLAIGDAMVHDYTLLFENHGLRVIQLNLPYGIASLSCGDPARLNAFIFLREDLPAERRLFLLIQELGWIYLANADRHGLQIKTLSRERPLSDDKFTRHFAACFLMPEDTVRAAFFRTGLHPEIFDLEILLTLKARFGVSAQSFCYRLAELGLLPDSQATLFRQELERRYRETGREPGRSRHDWKNARLNDLMTVARRRTDPQSHQPIFDAITAGFRVEDE